ncbi:MAG: nucleotidyltransferase domain-containing protein [Calditrichaeota bacterium]|nr:nucleotidyltransferase domain-containing protein [Spirochaetales bacterium]RQW04869.1 MAG: nucleotidyltransferase domain-containing protein [Calditrichota bacterium]
MNINFDEIVEKLIPLDPEQIILFGSYAKGTASENSDIDICIVKSDIKSSQSSFKLKARKNLRDFILTNHIGIDILTISEEDLNNKEDYFYKEDLVKNGKILYAK